MSSTTRTRICPICEATCGLELEVSGREVTAIRGYAADVFSQGFLCPKGVALRELDSDPDRLRQPLIRREGRHVPATFDEAFSEIDRRLSPLIEAHGRDSLGIYVGNPSAHNPQLLLYGQQLLRAFPSRNRFSASTLDQLPKQLACSLMFGGGLTVPIPDIDRTQYLLMLGADPMQSNGSLFTAPNFRRRVRELRERGGRLVVVDPRRSRTAEMADRHLFIRPGTDAHFLLGIACALFEANRVQLGPLEAHVSGLEAVRSAVLGLTPDKMAKSCGIPAAEIRRVAEELADAPSAAVYGRVGTTTHAFGTTASWAVDLLNVLTGNLDRPGGVMFPKAAAFAANADGAPPIGRERRIGRWSSRVRGLPEVFGELPTACLAEEIDTPGEGRIRALLTVAGNPVLSSPNSARLSRALEQLDFMVSLDIYQNETTRHADVILPGLSPLEQSHFDIVFPQLSVRNCARYSKPVFDPPADQLPEWKILLRLTSILLGQGLEADLDAIDDATIGFVVQASVTTPHSPLHGRDPAEITQALSARSGPDRMIDFALRAGPYGDAFGAREGGLSLALLERQPAGVDLGPLEPRIPELLRTPSGKIELAPPQLLEDLFRLEALTPADAGEGELLLVGRRHVRSNNSWMHNLPVLARGALRCTLQVHPEDAERRGLVEGQPARICSRVGEVTAPVELTDSVMVGVVSLPHGWGHDEPGTQMGVAAERPGVNSNRLSDDQAIDPLSGTAVLNGTPVRVGPA